MSALTVSMRDVERDVGATVVAGHPGPDPGRRIVGAEDTGALDDLTHTVGAHQRAGAGHAEPARDGVAAGQLGDPEGEGEPAEALRHLALAACVGWIAYRLAHAQGDERRTAPRPAGTAPA